MNLRATRFRNLFLLLLSWAFCIGILTEIGVRFLLKDRLSIIEDERNLTYRFDDQLGWFPVESSKQLYAGSRSIEVEHNSRGFRDSEHIVDTKPRIIFLGDSLVWGFDVEKQERFTEKLREKLAGWSLYNLGVSGYGTDQEYLLLRQQYDFYEPNIVVLVFCTDNDGGDNSHNIRYGGYYKPYFISNGDSLTLNGVPVPESENYFFARHNILAQSYGLRLLAKAYFKYIASPSPPSLELNDPTHAVIVNMNKFVKSRGAEFLVGLQGGDPKLETFLKNEGIDYIDLSNPFVYPTHGRHWTPDGHAFVSERIYDFLMRGKYLQRFTVPN